MNIKDMFFFKELLLSFVSMVGINTITFILFRIGARIIGMERLYYMNQHADHEGAINTMREHGANSDEFKYGYEYSPTEVISKKFKEKGIFKGITYVIFEFLPEVFYSTLFPEDKIMRRNDIIFAANIILILVLRYFLFVIPDFSIFYVDFLLFSYMLSTVLMVFGVIFIPHNKNQVFNNYLVFISSSSVVFFILILAAFVLSSGQKLNSSVIWLLSYTLIVGPLGYLIMNAKLIMSIGIESDRTDVKQNMRSLFGKMEDK